MDLAVGKENAGMADRSGLVAALDRVGDRWSLLLVDAMLAGPRRFNELLEELPGIAPNVLTDRLRRLEQAGVVAARPYSRRPPRFAYELTAAGAELSGALVLLASWGAGGADGAEPPRHAACGTALEVSWYCPTCAEPASGDADHGPLHYA